MSRKDPHKSGAMGMLLEGLQDQPMKRHTREPESSVKPDASAGAAAGTATRKKPATPKSKPAGDGESSKPPARPKGGEQVVELDTAKIKPWPFVNRPESDMGDMEGLTNSIKDNGQQMPILVRPAPKRSDCDYEYYAGHRRFTGCEQLGIKVKAIVRDATDQEAAAIQELENEQRNGLSSWAKAVHYQKLLDAKVFPSSQALATHLGLTRATVTDTLAYFRIDPAVREAIGDLSKVSVFSAKIISGLNEDKQKSALVELADRIRAGTLKGNSIKKEVQRLASGASREAKRTVRGKAGDLLTVRSDSNGTPILSLLKDARDLCETDELVGLIREHLDRKYAEKGGGK